MPKNKNTKTNRAKPNQAEHTGYLFAMLGNSVGIDCVPYLATLGKENSSQKLMKGRARFYKDKKQF